MIWIDSDWSFPPGLTGHRCPGFPRVSSALPGAPDLSIAQEAFLSTSLLFRLSGGGGGGGSELVQLLLQAQQKLHIAIRCPLHDSITRKGREGIVSSTELAREGDTELVKRKEH